MSDVRIEIDHDQARLDKLYDRAAPHLLRLLGDNAPADLQYLALQFMRQVIICFEALDTAVAEMEREDELEQKAEKP